MGNSGQQGSLYKINEIFYSIQAEGFHAGKAAVFIRFCDCNLRCDFCDTEFLTGVEMSAPEILANIRDYPCKFVVITGGEPLMCDTTELAEILKNEGYYITVETNGMFLPKHALFDWITVSPKNNKVKINECQELKVLLGQDEIPEKYGIQAEHYFISPKNPTHNLPIGTRSAEFFDTNVAQYCFRYVLKHPEWRLSLQIHKVIGVK
ncbi:MAG: 7-carboxy-7-deazaguanine synthase QueE [Candidatus Neomarinimicrobiota bacterium]|jgi:organic radical activating enzyme|nr:7-carboxy-7-deazaguanine synthase QueE [Candidatus Neomarinimicrobiota bacterium]MDD3965520.1 7-carboxy-7-deazaguanine synthase QueE [Candidatus Neomarinimicrobiota bacterium]MDX9780587.1 7-carboxy-7-deazaguanine synthase QueE [bacterium]